jgi:nitrate reductase delta subunit
MADVERKRTFALFAEMLEYPRADLRAAVRECQQLVAPASPEAAAQLGAFGDFVERTPPGRLEEVYTGTFDLDAACHPYVGFHLFGDSYKRSAFLLGLKERCRKFGVPAGSELPDHIAVVMRLLAACKDAGEARGITLEALLPALEKMLGPDAAQGPAEAGAPAGAQGERGEAAGPPAGSREESEALAYRGVLRALRLVLEREAAVAATA